MLCNPVIKEGHGAVADDATACHAGRPVAVPVVEHAAAAADSGPIIQDAAARHRRDVRVVYAAAEISRVARADSADGAIVLDVQRVRVIHAPTVGGSRVIQDAAYRHRRHAGPVEGAAVVFGVTFADGLTAQGDRVDAAASIRHILTKR